MTDTTDVVTEIDLNHWSSSIVGWADITCPFCGTVLHVPIHAGKPREPLHEAGRVVGTVFVDLEPDHHTLHAHAAVCPGPDGPGDGEEWPVAV